MDSVIIPPSELIIDFARSGGPGGQNVNKIESKVIVRWRVGESLVLTDEAKSLIRTKLANRLNNADEIVIQADEERSQAQNKERAIERLNSLVTRALFVPKKRRPTKPTMASRRKRLEVKNKTSRLKKTRMKQQFEE